MSEHHGGSVPDLVALYVPGNRPALFDKALAGPADVIILDLEDAVPLASKDEARSVVCGWLRDQPAPVRARVSVRINAVGTVHHRDDTAALSRVPGLHSVRVPKVESAAHVVSVVSVVGEIPVHALLESAAGIEAAFAIATTPGVGAMAIGEADLRSDLGVTADEGLSWVRSRVIVAARAAGLPAPMMSAWTDLSDMAGLLESCQKGRGLGFLGRTAVHPSQINAIRVGFRPSTAEVERAKQLLDTLSEAFEAGSAIAVTADGRMVDRAMVEGARRILAIAGA